MFILPIGTIVHFCCYSVTTGDGTLRCSCIAWCGTFVVAWALLLHYSEHFVLLMMTSCYMMEVGILVVRPSLYRCHLLMSIWAFQSRSVWHWTFTFVLDTLLLMHYSVFSVWWYVHFSHCYHLFVALFCIAILHCFILHSSFSLMMMTLLWYNALFISGKHSVAFLVRCPRALLLYRSPTFDADDILHCCSSLMWSLFVGRDVSVLDIGRHWSDIHDALLFIVDTHLWYSFSVVTLCYYSLLFILLPCDKYSDCILLHSVLTFILYCCAFVDWYTWCVFCVHLFLLRLFHFAPTVNRAFSLVAVVDILH